MFFAGQALVPGVDYEARWVHPLLGHDLNPGTQALPFATVARALEVVAAGPTGGNAAVITLLGDNVVIPVGGTPPPIHNRVELTIVAGEGHQPWFAPGSAGGPELLPVDRLLLRGLHVDLSWNEMFRAGPGGQDSRLVFEHCLFRGRTHPRQWPALATPRVLRLHPAGDYANGAGVAVADCAMVDIDGSCHAGLGWMRGVQIRNCLVGGFGGSNCLIDCRVMGSPETANVSSSGLLVAGPGRIENVLYDSIEVLDHTGVLLDVRQEFEGVAVVNCTLEGENGFYFAESFVGSLFAGEQRHLLLDHCTSPQRLNVEYPSNWLFGHMFGGLVSHCIFGDVRDSVVGGNPLHANLGGNPALDGLSGLPVDGLHLEPRFQHLHANVPAWAWWTHGTYQDTYVGLSTNDLRVRATSPASLSIPAAAATISHDQEAHRRGDVYGATTPGSLRSLGE